MKKKYLIGGAVIVIFLGAMAYLLTQSNIGYEVNFSSVKTAGTKTIRCSGIWVKEKNYEIDQQQRTFTFYIKDAEGIEMKVVYNGAMPNNFESATSVVVTGQYKNDTFFAKDILTKCPSKYEERQKQAAQS